MFHKTTFLSSNERFEWSTDTTIEILTNKDLLRHGDDDTSNDAISKHERKRASFTRKLVIISAIDFDWLPCASGFDGIKKKRI